MKNLNLALLIAGFLLAPLCGVSQMVNKRTITVAKAGSSKSVTLNRSYTYTMFTSILGEPNSKRTDIDGEITMMKYENNIFYLYANVFNCFEFTDNTYKINGIVGVGDTVSKIELLNPFKLTSRSKGANKSTYSAYITNTDYDMSPIYFDVENGQIVKISYAYTDDI
jgi:hypothetical protein